MHARVARINLAGVEVAFEARADRVEQQRADIGERAAVVRLAHGLKQPSVAELTDEVVEAITGAPARGMAVDRRVTRFVQLEPGLLLASLIRVVVMSDFGSPPITATTISDVHTVPHWQHAYRGESACRELELRELTSKPTERESVPAEPGTARRRDSADQFRSSVVGGANDEGLFPGGAALEPYRRFAKANFRARRFYDSSTTWAYGTSEATTRDLARLSRDNSLYNIWQVDLSPWLAK